MVKQAQREMGEATSAVTAALDGAKGMVNYFLGDTPAGQDHFSFTPVEGRIPDIRLSVRRHTGVLISDFWASDVRMLQVLCVKFHVHLQVPDDDKQQWDIIISVYAKGITKNMPHATRVAYQRIP